VARAARAPRRRLNRQRCERRGRRSRQLGAPRLSASGSSWPQRRSGSGVNIALTPDSAARDAGSCVA
jgi:hypothetical protein